jgi:mono/diheme cytochrome c family protein
MTKTIRSHAVIAAMAVAVSLASAVCFAQSAGEATYKAKCQGCHGTAGTPTPGIAKMMGVKSVTDPEIKKLTADEMIAAVKNGKNKMPAQKDKLTDVEIKGAVEYYRSLGK